MTTAFSSGLCGPPVASTRDCWTLPITEDSLTLGGVSPSLRSESKKVLVWSPSTADTQVLALLSPTARCATSV